MAFLAAVKDKQLEPDKEVSTGIVKHCVKVKRRSGTQHSEIDVFSEYNTGCAISAVS
jgi:hypothetical protein